MKSLQNFLDADGKVRVWPSKMENKLLILRYVSEKFELGRTYAEREVNEIINRWQTVGDLFLFRRGMIDAGFMTRTRTGSEYARVVMEAREGEA